MSIKINILDQELTIEEARKVYEQLKELFGKDLTYPPIQGEEVDFDKWEDGSGYKPWTPRVWLSSCTKFPSLKGF